MLVFFFQAEDGIRDLVRSRGLGDVYKRQESVSAKKEPISQKQRVETVGAQSAEVGPKPQPVSCLLYTSDAADERSSVDLGGRSIIKKKSM